jgi:hypothetical protein
MVYRRKTYKANKQTNKKKQQQNKTKNKTKKEEKNTRIFFYESRIKSRIFVE